MIRFYSLLSSPSWYLTGCIRSSRKERIQDRFQELGGIDGLHHQIGTSAHTHILKHVEGDVVT